MLTFKFRLSFWSAVLTFKLQLSVYWNLTPARLPNPCPVRLSPRLDPHPWKSHPCNLTTRLQLQPHSNQQISLTRELRVVGHVLPGYMGSQKGHFFHCFGSKSTKTQPFSIILSAKKSKIASRTIWRHPRSMNPSKKGQKTCFAKKYAFAQNGRN